MNEFKLVPVEPVAFCEDAALSLAERSFSMDVDEQLASDIIQYAQRLHLLYATHQPTPDVSELVDALTMARETIACALRVNAPDYFTTDAETARHVVIQRIDAALAAYRKGGEA